jgi:Amt family ammonium transporter
MANNMDKVTELEAYATELIAKISYLESLNSSAERELGSGIFDESGTSYMLFSTTTVLFMTIPGLALYYAGMVRAENVLATTMQIFGITCLITFLWFTFGYSLAFGPASSDKTGNAIYGDYSRFWLEGMSLNSVHQNYLTIPESLYCIYQLVFAIITPSIICGSFAGRMNFLPMLIFIGLWHLIVYCPIAHMVWHPDGFLYKEGVLDTAGGLVVHISGGVAGLVSTLVIGNRIGYGDPREAESFEPYNVLFTFIGTCMLWIGWFGFNAGSANFANFQSSYALLNTQIAASVGGLSWLFVEWCFRGKPSILGIANGALSGLVSITPACGFVNITGNN